MRKNARATLALVLERDVEPDAVARHFAFLDRDIEAPSSIVTSKRVASATRISRTVCATVSTALRAAASQESGLTPMTSVTRYTLSLILAPLSRIDPDVHDRPVLKDLGDGVQMPVLGLGVWQMDEGAETENAVEWALEAGYRHVDTAQLYRNERSVGAAIRASGIPREEIFVTTKWLPTVRSAGRALEQSLERLGMTTSTCT